MTRMICDYRLLGICLTNPPIDTSFSLFSVSDFLTALALLALAFNATDPLYRFRIDVAPIPLRRIAFFSSIVVGALTLLTDLWFAERWPALPWGLKRATIQGLLGAAFLSIIFTWLWFAFVRRPTFNRWNYKRFYNAILWRLIRGSSIELAAIAGEIAHLADSLVENTALTQTAKRRSDEKRPDKRPGIADFAHDTLLLLGHRKFCRVVVASSSDTAVALMHAAIRRRKYAVPLGRFAQNITAEAILNPDSPIYHEDRLSLMSVFGSMQPFSTAMYGNYSLVAGIGEVLSSPFDLDWQVMHGFTGKQWEAFCSIVLITFEAYISQGHFGTHSSLLYRAFGQISDAGDEVYLLNGGSASVGGGEPRAKLSASARFARDILTALEKVQDTRFIQMRTPPKGETGHYSGICDWVAEMMYKIILHASAVKQPDDLAWAIHYNTVWTNIFGYGEPKGAARVVLFKLRRLLFDEIKDMKRFPNFEGARILGICLNVLGVDDSKQPKLKRSDEPLRRAVAGWAKRNYLGLALDNPRVAESSMIGSISFDAESRRIIKSYNQGLRLEPHKLYLDLSGPNPKGYRG